MSEVYLSTFGMNAGMDNSHDVLLKTLKNYQAFFKKILVCDGRLTDSAKEYYSKLNNLEVDDYPWDDNYYARYKRNADKVPNNSWMLHLDSDEIPSGSLIDFISSKEFIELKEKYNTLCLPCILYLTEDGRKFYASEKEPEKEYTGQWFKNILFKKDETLTFTYHGSHVVPNHGIKEKGFYIPYPYLHFKSLESFVYNDCLQAFLLPEAQHFSRLDAKQFKLLTSCYKSMNEFKNSLIKGTWSPPLKKFAWERRQVYSNPVSRLAWAYWILEGHPMPEEDSFMDWNNIKNFIIDLKIYNKNKKEGNYIEI